MTDPPPAASESPTCPACGRPIAILTVLGPTDGVAAPCGCRVPPRPRLESD